jgi:AbrB family looped-hinge helix DNA binding protein
LTHGEIADKIKSTEYPHKFRHKELIPMTTVKVGRRGQITLPSDLRRRMGISEGDHIAVFTQGDRLILHPINQTLLDLRGSIQVSSEQDFSEIRQRVIRTHVFESVENDG